MRTGLLDMDVWEEGRLRRGYLLRLVFGDDRASVSYFVDTGASPQIDYLASSE